MKKGYRLSSGNAIANYHIYKYGTADFYAGQKLVQGVGDLWGKGVKAASGMVDNVGGKTMGFAQDAVTRGSKFMNSQKNNIRKLAKNKDFTRNVGMGVLGAGALAAGGAGLAGYNALNGGGGQQQQY